MGKSGDRLPGCILATLIFSDIIMAICFAAPHNKGHLVTHIENETFVSVVHVSSDYNIHFLFTGHIQSNPPLIHIMRG